MVASAKATCVKRKRQGHLYSEVASRNTSNNSSNGDQEMPLVQKGPPSPTILGSCCEDEDDEKETHSNKKVRRQPAKESKDKDSSAGNHDDEDMEDLAPPMSPRVRKRLDDAKENASLFGPVCSQGEVIQWMSACHPELIEFGRELENRGFHTLSSIAFLTEDDIDCNIDAAIKQLLLTTLSRLRHEFFRM